MLDIREDFETGSGKLASFFRRSEERWDPGELLEELFSTYCDPKTLEYLLFSFLHLGRSDLDAARDVIRLRRLTILLMKAVNFSQSLSNKEYLIIERLRQELNLVSLSQFFSLRKAAAARVNQLFAGEELDQDQRGQLSTLLESEAEALAERLSFITDKIDPYDMKSMSKVLPLVTIYEERAKTYKGLASSIKTGQVIGRKILYFEYLMKEDGFEKWIKRVAKNDQLEKFLGAMMIQREKQVPTMSLVAVSSIARCVLGPDSTPLDWAAFALEHCSGTRFTIDCSGKESAVQKLLKGGSIALEGNILDVDFLSETLSNLVGTDLLTVTSKKGDIEIYDLVCRSIANDSLMLRFLDNPKVYSRPGLVEYIVKSSRSLAVLTKIASTRTLYSGSANAGVPAALLKSPCMIPLSLLRGFVSTRHVAIADLRDIFRSPHTVRRDVYREVEDFMKRRG